MMQKDNHRLKLAIPAILVAAVVAPPPSVSAQEHHSSRVDLSFNRFYSYDELTEAMHKLQEAYPELLTLQSIGKSVEDRDLWLMTINNPKTGDDRDKPAIYIDGNVHGNEVQAAEVCLYTIWYLTKSYGKVEKLTKLLDARVLYILPSVNPDGRAHWLDNPNTSHSSRSGKAPTDNDYDGLYDEDGYDDLDGDGHITGMWKKDPNGRFRRSNKDPRIMERVAADEKGQYMWLGSEGIDNDGDGRINEDGPGGYDMNRNWPADWQPGYVQYGAGDYPFCYPETAAIGAFILDHPNIAAAQSYHNAGGMILRGPGTQQREDYYPREDVAVYDEIGKTGERILPHYKYMILWKDLYTVHGGFVTWTSEDLAIFSFTNELWTNDRYFSGAEGDWSRNEARLKFGDLLQFEDLFSPFKPYNHPTYGEILIGGWDKYASRVPPTFMLEELCHRNFAFTIYHADQMPKLSFSRVRIKSLDPGIWEVTVEVANSAAIPTISGLAAQKKIGARDQITLRAAAGGNVRVLTSGTLDGWFDKTMTLEPVGGPRTGHPERIWLDTGVGSHAQRQFRWIVDGSGTVDIRYWSQKGGRVVRTIELTETPGPNPRP